ncbi:MAG: DoxX family protein [Candidatus Solibacter sp.]|nr:DoxX family protein [Candidatus Solibacter sp.]
MKTAIPALQIIVALGLLNVWLLRFNRSTAYRGSQARSMPEEFAAYGLPGWFTYVVGALKVGGALCLITGIWIESLVLPAALVIGILMVGALAMHLKIGDPWKKSVPALFMLTFCIIIFWGLIR